MVSYSLAFLAFPSFCAMITSAGVGVSAANHARHGLLVAVHRRRRLWRSRVADHCAERGDVARTRESADQQARAGNDGYAAGAGRAGGCG